MKSFREKYKSDMTSQNGENGIIQEVITRIWDKPFAECFGRAIEFGAPTKQYCSNIFPLGEKWSKYYYDISPNEPGITKVEITPDNVNYIIRDCEVLSIDIDNNDYNVWAAYNESPDIVIIEVNSSVPPPIEMIPTGSGSSYMSMLHLGLSKGYFLLCHTGNMIFVLNAYRHLFPEIIGDGIWNFSEYFNTEFL
jgi:hypothetical protein